MLVNWKGAKYGIDKEEKEKIGKEIMRKSENRRKETRALRL